MAAESPRSWSHSLMTWVESLAMATSWQSRERKAAREEEKAASSLEESGSRAAANTRVQW